MLNTIIHAAKQIFSGEKTDLATQQERLAKCRNCKQLFQLTGNCKICGCFVREKVKYRTEYCPLNYWSAV